MVLHTENVDNVDNFVNNYRLSKFSRNLNVDNFVIWVWKQCESSVDRQVFHKTDEKVNLSCAQPANNWKLWNFAMALGKKLTITHTYPQLINILWISGKD